MRKGDEEASGEFLSAGERGRFAPCGKLKRSLCSPQGRVKSAIAAPLTLGEPPEQRPIHASCRPHTDTPAPGYSSDDTASRIYLFIARLFPVDLSVREDRASF